MRLTINSKLVSISAMWMLPEDWVYGEWPLSGEIDIVEIIGKIVDYAIN